MNYHIPREQRPGHLKIGTRPSTVHAVTRDLVDEIGCKALISKKGFPLQAGARWVVERTNSWHNRGFKKLTICTERRARVIDAFITLANAAIITRRLLREAWTTHRWEPDQHTDHDL